MDGVVSYCLTLRETPWRTAAARARFAAAGLEPSWFYGLHGASLALAGTLECPGMPPATPGRAGLFLSFMFLWQHALLAHPDEEAFLFFEDDATPADGFAAALKEAAAELPAGWGVLRVGWMDRPGLVKTPYSRLLARCAYPYGNQCTLWRRQALESALDALSRGPVCTHLDVTLAALAYPRLDHFICRTPLAGHASPAEADSAALTLSWRDVNGWFDYARLYDEAVARVRGPATFVEIGGWYGQSAAYMATEVRRRLLPVTFYVIDTWVGTAGNASMAEALAREGGDMMPAFMKNIAACGAANSVVPLRSDSADAARLFADASVDFVFVDGDHTLEGCRRDILAWLPKLRPGGVMAGHDVDWKGVKAAVDSVFGPGGYRTWERCWIVGP